MEEGNTVTKKRKFTWVQGCWSLSCTLMMGAAILAFLKGEANLADIAVPLGIAMFFSGWVNMLVYHKQCKIMHGAHWLLADGMSTALLSIFLLFNQMIEAATIPFFFGVWELFSGVLKSIDAKELKTERMAGWKRFAAVGLFEIVSGIAALLKPVDDFVGMHIVVAVILFVQACGILFKIMIYPTLVDRD